MKVILDFTIKGLTDNIEVAIMPNELAKTLLKEYAKKLGTTSTIEIIQEHCNDLRKSKSVDEAVQKSLSWTNERFIIDNISKENWNIFLVKESIPDNELEQVIINNQ